MKKVAFLLALTLGSGTPVFSMKQGFFRQQRDLCKRATKKADKNNVFYYCLGASISASAAYMYKDTVDRKSFSNYVANKSRDEEKKVRTIRILPKV